MLFFALSRNGIPGLIRLEWDRFSHAFPVSLEQSLSGRDFSFPAESPAGGQCVASASGFGLSVAGSVCVSGCVIGIREFGFWRRVQASIAFS